MYPTAIVWLLFLAGVFFYICGLYQYLIRKDLRTAALAMIFGFASWGILFAMLITNR